MLLLSDREVFQKHDQETLDWIKYPLEMVRKVIYMILVYQTMKFIWYAWKCYCFVEERLENAGGQGTTRKRMVEKVILNKIDAQAKFAVANGGVCNVNQFTVICFWWSVIQLWQ